MNNLFKKKNKEFKFNEDNENIDKINKDENNDNKNIELEESERLEEEFNRIRMMIQNKYKNKQKEQNTEMDFDVKYIEYEGIYGLNQILIDENEYIERIKNMDKFFFDDYKKIDEDKLKELMDKKKEGSPDFEIVCFFKYNFIRQKGFFEEYQEKEKVLILKNKFEHQKVIDFDKYYLYGKIRSYGNRDDFRRKMELFLKCHSIVVKKRKNINNDDKNNEKLIKELNESDDIDENDYFLEDKNNKIENNENIEKEDLEEMDERKIEFINSIINKVIR